LETEFLIISPKSVLKLNTSAHLGCLYKIIRGRT